MKGTQIFKVLNALPYTIYVLHVKKHIADQATYV